MPRVASNAGGNGLEVVPGQGGQLLDGFEGDIVQVGVDLCRVGRALLQGEPARGRPGRSVELRGQTLPLAQMCDVIRIGRPPCPSRAGSPPPRTRT